MKAFIQIAYRQIIDSTCTENFEKNILRISHQEFVLKSQVYNREKKFRTLQQLVDNDGRANSLHDKSKFAVEQIINGLKNKMPHLLDSLGRQVAFSSYKFEIISSDIADESSHKVAITYMTDTLALYGNMGDHLLLAGTNGHNNKQELISVDTFILKMQPGLSIFNYLEVINESEPDNFHAEMNERKNHL